MHSEIAHQYGAFKIFLMMMSGEMGQLKDGSLKNKLYLASRYTLACSSHRQENSKTSSQKNIIYQASRYTHCVTTNQIYRNCITFVLG